ncbi:probable aspartyl protease At4g16563 [Euphorbia lathyris]|uniref:probable aspartyl protease At4g16563 n=1 Tax=Euphorbia lathyris TaxID=212925 RepID=UPI003313F6F0
MATLNKVTKFLLFILHLFFISNQSLAKQKNPNNRLILSLTHSSTSLPHPKHSRTKLTQLDQTMIEPLREVRDGYLISLNIGTPPQVIQVYMDTGSDLTWVPCGNLSFDCLNCDEYKNSKLTSAFSSSSSSTYYRDSCSSPFCIEIHSSDNPFDSCTMSGCSLATIVKGNCPRPCPSFAYTYGAGGVVIGTLTRDSIRVHENRGFSFREISKFVFGCVGSTYHEPIGIAGFGRGKLSFPSQLGLVKKGFSHCFLPFKYSNNPNFSSSLIIGDVALSSNDKDDNFMQFTPMLKSPIYPNYYYIGLESITLIGDNNISAINTQVQSNLREFDSLGNGGMLIDSGTTYTHLPEPLYSQLLSALKSAIDYPRAFEVEMRSGFDLCYKVPCSDNSSSNGFEFPAISFHFLNNVSVVLPQENHFYAMSAPSNSSVVKCLLFQSMEDGDFGPAAVFGSFQQQNLKVVYDLENERIGFQPMDCALDETS